MQRKQFVLAFLLLISLPFSLCADTWRVFFYMDSSDALSDMAIKNVTDMVRGKPNDMVEFFIQLHAYYDAGLRYRVIEKGLEFIEEILLSGDSKQDFINAAEWGFVDNDCDHTMLIMSNHGYGILDPHWNDVTNEWEMDTGSLNDQCGCVLKSLKEHKKHRGFMFSTTPRTYLTNNNLVAGLEVINCDILNNKKIDILAFDTCMGDMFEIAYLVAPYAHYLVGNQSCSLVDGFDYQGVMAILNRGLSVRDLGVGMVDAFDAYYSEHDSSGVYTHAVLDLLHMHTVNDALNAVVAQLLSVPHIENLLVEARNRSPRFCLWPMYTDLIAFCKLVEVGLSEMQPSDAISAVADALQNFYETISSLIIARCGGFTTEDLAHGVAIYLPWREIDSSYYATHFVQQSLWIKLLEAIVDFEKVDDCFSA